MATGYVTPTTHANLIPESWSKEVILALYDKLIMRKLVNSMDVPKGMDTVHFPNIAALTAEEITPGTALVGKVNTEGTTALSISEWWGVPITFSKMALIQAMQNINYFKMYGERMAEALAYKIDADLLGMYANLSQSITCTTDITDAYLRQGITYLDEANAPDENRHLVIAPTQKEALLGLDKFSLVSNFGSSDPIQKGVFGQIYGVNVWSTEAVLLATTRKNLLFHRDFAMLGIQQDIEIDPPEYHTLKQAWDVVGTVLYGYAEMRDTFGVTLTTTT